ncbi:hypothetical protein [Mesorhizobium sp.]|uniref:hypothetical protein n=1 Tax=Mesorhizobium sp. TaxID=1871066 RepID=UPI000FE35344|nr:hypothetical protein [Mesorhizobium sp.]RWH95499.1 MAG: hypothetical protein EOQ89_31125 [Mesorhizobium sp.]RWK17368.1 MAG: hypothetical protein EOR43_28150 [Mesorhizobium sp.]RWK27241.1 MAG: hypothetical protein EOR44_28240 [Mesorhizobium sp.]RWM20257.1 MAG: hypothetical protein EOR74_31255 [Mesorhizobium sp.]
MSKPKWLIAALFLGLKRQPLKKINADAPALLKLLQSWRDQGGQAGHTIKRIGVAYEAAGDGFWLARWLRARGIEAYAIHPSMVPVSRAPPRQDQSLDTEILMRAFVGWLRGEKRHCYMATWRQSRRLRRKMRGGRTASGGSWSTSRRGSSTASRRSSPASASAASG